MRTFIPDPALKAWYDAAIRATITIRNYGGGSYPFQSVPIPPLPPRPLDPIQAGFYDGVLVRIANAVNRFNAEANRLNTQIQTPQYQTTAPANPEFYGSAP